MLPAVSSVMILVVIPVVLSAIGQYCRHLNRKISLAIAVQLPYDKTSRFISYLDLAEGPVMLRSPLLRLSALCLLSISSAAFASNTFDPPLDLTEKVIQKVSNDANAPEIRYAFLHQAEENRDLFHSLRLYDAEDKLLQTLEGEELRPHMMWGDIGSTPTLVDINEDGYSDLILKVSAGSLGEFSTIWFFNPASNRFEAVLEELLYPQVVGKNLISSSYTSRRDPFPSSLSVYKIAPDYTYQESNWGSVLIPLRKGEESYYCLSDPTLNSAGNVTYSLDVTLGENQKLTADSFATFDAIDLEEYCYPALSELAYHFPQDQLRALPLIHLSVWQEIEGNRSFKEAINVDPEWPTIPTDFQAFGETVTEAQCPVIPYVDLNERVIKSAVLPAFEDLPESVLSDDYGYPVICEYEGRF